tara:strand:- start:8048 stop:8500 length:453 start_codon:yes stop_codon:yes gene_type:complete
MSPNLRILLGLSIVCIGFFWNNIQERIPDFLPDRVEYYIEKPDEKTLEKTSSIASLVTDKNDREKLSVFNNVFSERVVLYDCNGQQVNDVYTLAAKEMFSDELKGKYNGYANGIIQLMRSVLGNENTPVKEDQKTLLSKDFSGLAWSLWH